MDSTTKHRLMLSLRSEKAFGLPVIVAPRIQTTSSVIHRPEPHQQSVEAARQSVVEGLRRPQSSVSAPPSPPAPAKIQREMFSLASAPPTEVETQQPFTAPVLPPDKKRVALTQLDENHVKGCPKCRLSQTRTNTVFGEGDPDAKIFFIGEGPGENEDQQGRPFVGRAGQLLDKMINAMGLKREQVFIANIVKCRPPNNRVPMPDEVAACTPYLMTQIEIVRPHAIVTLGRPAVQFMLNTNATMGSLRGRWQEWRGIRLMPTYHPSYVLRTYTPETRAAVWSDLKQVLEALKMPIPSRAV